jgi:hypothetical protein
MENIPWVFYGSLIDPDRFWSNSKNYYRSKHETYNKRVKLVQSCYFFPWFPIAIRCLPGKAIQAMQLQPAGPHEFAKSQGGVYSQLLPTQLALAARGEVWSFHRLPCTPGRTNWNKWWRNDEKRELFFQFQVPIAGYLSHPAHLPKDFYILLVLTITYCYLLLLTVTYYYLLLLTITYHYLLLLAHFEGHQVDQTHRRDPTIRLKQLTPRLFKIIH